MKRSENATESDWENWKCHTNHIIRNANRLDSLIQITDKEYHNVKFARKYKIPFGIILYYLPWEKKLSLADTYIYTDVSIYDYLKGLKSIGENISHYNTIWYYLTNPYTMNLF
jgi:hypothetical protein